MDATVATGAAAIMAIRVLLVIPSINAHVQQSCPSVSLAHSLTLLSLSLPPSLFLSLPPSLSPSLPLSLSPSLSPFRIMMFLRRGSYLYPSLPLSSGYKTSLMLSRILKSSRQHSTRVSTSRTTSSPESVTMATATLEQVHPIKKSIKTN